MLQSMRQGAQSTAAKIIIGLIVLSFAAFGLETLLPGGSGSSIAEVNGEEISPAALQEAVTQQKRRLVSILGEDIDPSLLDDDRLQPRALESLIQRILLLQRASALSLVASESQIGEAITSIETFQLNGVFSVDAYKSVLANAGYTPERFRRAQAEDIVLTQLQTAISESEFTTSTEFAAAVDLLAEERDVRYLVVPETGLIAEDALSDEALQAYYRDNEADFFYPERVIADYILLDAADFAISVDESTVLEQYEAVKDEYQVAEQARVSHILLTQGDDETDADFSGRLAMVSDRLSRGDDFADVAAELSDDLGSAGIGGELGFTDGTAFPEEMEAAIALLATPGEVSEPVETDAGTHFIRLEERIAGNAVDYESVKAELRESIEDAEAERALLVAAEELKDLVFNASDLAGPAAAIEVSVKTSEPFTLETGAGPFGEQRVRDLAFAPDVKDAGNNSDVIELSGQRFIVVRVNEVKPSQIAPFADVESQVRAEVAAAAEEEALTAIVDQAESMLMAGASVESVSKELNLEWRVELSATRLASQLPRPVRDAAFTMPAGDAATLRTVTLPGEGYAIVQLARVTPGQPSAITQTENQQLSNLRVNEQQQLSFDEFLAHQRDSADIVIR